MKKRIIKLLISFKITNHFMDCFTTTFLKNAAKKGSNTKQSIVFLLIVFFSGISFSSAQCPTATDTNQSFCDIQSPTVASLVATDNGGGIAWFATATSTTPLSFGGGLVNGEDYFLDNSAGNCGTRIQVFVSLATAPTGQNFQGVCVPTPSQATIASLNAVGNNVQWYNIAIGGAPLAANTVLNSGAIYYAGQTNPITGCLTSRLAVFVVVNVVAIPSGDAVQFFCNEATNPPTVADLVATGANNWYLTNTSAFVLVPETLLVDGQTYYATTTVPPCESTQRLEVLVNLIPENDAGEGGTLGICEIDLLTAATVNLFDQLAGTPSNLGFWTGPIATNNGNLGTLNLSSLDVSAIPYVFTYTVSSLNTCPLSEATVTVIIEPFLNAGSNATITFCESEVPTDLFTFLGGNPDFGGTWTPELASGTGEFDASIDLAGIYTYTLPGTINCPPDSATVTVTLVDNFNAGTNGNITFCESEIPTDLFAFLGGNPDLGGTWSPSLASGTGIFDVTTDVSGVYTYTVAGTASCPSDEATVTVLITDVVDAGTDGNATICVNEIPIDLFTYLGGNPDLGGTWFPSLSSGTGEFDASIDLAGIYTYTLPGTINCPSDSATVTVTLVDNFNAGTNGNITFCESEIPTDLFAFLGGNPNLGGTWSPSLASGTGIFDVTTDVSGVYTYTVAGTASCPSDEATVTVLITDVLNAGTDGNATICVNEIPIDLFTYLGGNPDLGGTWFPSLSSGTSVFDPSADSAGFYTYTLPGTINCPTDSATILVTIVENLDAGTSGNAVFCEGDVSLDLLDFLGDNPNLGGEWTPALTSGTGVFDPAIDLAGIYTYTLIGTSNCPSDTATVTVTIVDNADAGTNGDAVFCENEVPTDLFAFLGGNPDTGGTWSPTLASESGIFDPAIDPAGDYTYFLAGTGSCPSSSATVSVFIDEILEAGDNGNFFICETNLSTITTLNLFDQLLGMPSDTGEWTGPIATTNGNLGTVDFTSLALSGSPYEFTYTVLNSNACPPTQATVTITIEPFLNAGTDGTVVFCESGVPTDLFLSLGGNPSPGGTWSPALTSGNGIFNPGTDLAGNYTYTHTASTSCPADFAKVTVSIIENANAGISGNITFCENDSPTDLFTILGGNPDLGGLWSPTLSSGTGIFDPSQDQAGTYTYTLSGTNPCLEISSEVNVVVDQLPSSSLATLNLGTICLNADANIIITNAINVPNGNYQLTYEISGQILFNETIGVVFQNGSTSFTIPAAVFNAIGSSVLTVSSIEFDAANACGASVILFTPVSFTIDEIATPTFNGTTLFCETDNATLAELSAGIIESASIVWYDAAINGLALTTTTELINGTTYYAAIVSATGCESAVRLAITVTIDDCTDDELVIPDGFSPNGDGINDAFVLKNIRTLYPNFAILIYNRWGNVLFEGNANKPDWDGNNEKGISIGGQKPPVGVYFFVLNYNDGVKKDLQGRVYLSK
jgi:gliding motility-associated-like protein